MNVDSAAVLNDIDDKAMTDGETKVTFGYVVKQGMLNLSPEEKNTPADLKRKRYLLAKKFSKGGIVELSQPEIDLIKEVIGKQFIPIIVGRCDEILDNSFEIPYKTERILTSVGSDSSETNEGS